MDCTTHRLVRLDSKYLPYRYLCQRCKKLLKIASGVHIETPEVLACYYPDPNRGDP